MQEQQLGPVRQVRPLGVKLDRVAAGVDALNRAVLAISDSENTVMNAEVGGQRFRQAGEVEALCLARARSQKDRTAIPQRRPQTRNVSSGGVVDCIERPHTVSVARSLSRRTTARRTSLGPIRTKTRGNTKESGESRDLAGRQGVLGRQRGKPNELADFTAKRSRVNDFALSSV